MLETKYQYSNDNIGIWYFSYTDTYRIACSIGTNDKNHILYLIYRKIPRSAYSVHDDFITKIMSFLF